MDIVQDLLAEWSANGLMVPCAVTEYFSTTDGSTAYTIGESGSPTLNTELPLNIIRAWVRDDNIDTSIEIIGERQYNLIADKTVAGSPEKMFVKYGSPNLSVYLYPTPDAVYDVYFSHYKALNEPAYFTDSLLNTLEIPRYYYNAIKHNAALEVAAYFEKQPSEFMNFRAKQTKAQLLALNLAKSLESATFELVTPGNTGTIISY